MRRICTASDSFATGKGNARMPARVDGMRAGWRFLVVGACIVAGIVTVWTMHHGRIEAPVPAPITTTRVSSRPPTGAASVLWLLSIGVSRYRQAELNLQFAAADARAIAATLQLQSAGALYREAKTLVLTDEEVTRESILDSLERFLGQAGPDDVAVIFVAGHGVRDQASGSYYFLPFAATAQNLVSAGLRMSDFDEIVRVVRHNVRAVVVMLDTCHAGALRVSAPGLVAADDPAARMSAGEGFFLLAATKPGEDSVEEPALAHGAFTYAVLEGLQGAADVDGDGLVTVSDLFSYVARRVPQITNGEQHPYHKEEGTDLVFAAIAGESVALAPAATVEASAPALPRLAVTPALNTIGVMEFRDLRGEAEHDWIGKALRVALNTELSKVRALRVYSPELIDRATASRRVDHLTTAQRLGIRKLITGSFHVVGNTVRIDAEIVDTASGVQEGSDSVQGDIADFFALQKTLVLSMLRRLRVELSADEGASIEQRTNTNVDAYRLLLEAEGVVEQPSPSPSVHSGVPGTPHSWWHDGLRTFAGIVVAPAVAAEPAGDPATEVRQVIEAYRSALEHKDLPRLEALYTAFSARQREALRAYLENATGLTVTFSDVTIEPRGDEVAVSYTRRDQFVDKESAKPQHLEVRLTKILVRENGTWKISGGR
jgi:TolB-like protein